MGDETTNCCDGSTETKRTEEPCCKENTDGVYGADDEAVRALQQKANPQYNVHPRD